MTDPIADYLTRLRNAIANYSAILIPQTITEGFRVEFEINGKIYVWRAPENVANSPPKIPAKASEKFPIIVTLPSYFRYSFSRS